jgi:hypothetical protein
MNGEDFLQLKNAGGDEITIGFWATQQSGCIIMREVRRYEKLRSHQAGPEPLDKSAQAALDIPGRELRERHDPPVPRVQAREQAPFRWRKLPPPT